MPFVMPDELPATVAELDELRDQAQRSINVIQARHEAGEPLSSEDVETLRGLLDNVDAIGTARDEAAEAETTHQSQVDELMNRAHATGQPPDNPADDGSARQDDTEQSDDADADGDNSSGDGGQSEADADVDADPAPQQQREPVAADAAPPAPSFSGLGADDAPRNEGPGWKMSPGAPGYCSGPVGFAELAAAIDNVHTGSRSARRPDKYNGSYAFQTLAGLPRDVEMVDDSHALLAAISKATDQKQLPGGSLTAAGGWCAPSEQLYDFCDVPDAVDLVSLPEITIRRGGLRWPSEPDYSSLYSFLGWHFTETELEATDSGGDPTAIKTALTIDCPTEFTELRLEAIGYSVESDILQEQGWPELIENFLRHVTNGHLRGVSALTVSKMKADSTAVDLTATGAGSYVSASSTVLNGLALQAVNLRLNKGLARTATIEGVAPSWLSEIFKADFAQQEGLPVKNVSDAQVNGWLTSRNIALQYVGDWQARDSGKPGNLSTTAWPSSVNVLLYPAGTWFRSMSNVIELGVMYPRELLQVNRFTRVFTEDAIAVARRCDHSLNVEMSLNVNGGIGDRISLA